MIFYLLVIFVGIIGTV